MKMAWVKMKKKPWYPFLGKRSLSGVCKGITSAKSSWLGNAAFYGALAEEEPRLGLPRQGLTHYRWRLTRATATAKRTGALNNTAVHTDDGVSKNKKNKNISATVFLSAHEIGETVVKVLGIELVTFVRKCFPALDAYHEKRRCIFYIFYNQGEKERQKDFF